MKKIKKGFFIVIIIAALCCAGCLSFSASIKKSLSEIENNEINMDAISDGIYDGHSEMGPVVVDVKVHVENHKIVKVDLVRHDCGLGHPADVLADKIAEENTWQVDAVSGATVSSEIIKNAVNIALSQ